jgi:hypothetical protein
VLNIRIPNIHNLAKTDPRFRLYIYPAVVRDIFTHIFFIDGIEDIENPEDWHATWLEFARRFSTDDSLKQINLNEDRGEVLKWIDRLVEQFCASQSKDWRSLLSLEEVG